MKIQDWTTGGKSADIGGKPMPAKSPAQKRLMDAAAHNPAFAKKVGIPSKVAKEYSSESKGMKFQKGGEMKGESPIQKKAKDTAKMVKMAKGGKPCYARGGGVEIKGKTKGKMIAMKGSK